MAVLQAIAGFVYQIQVVSVYAYLPETARIVGQTRMNTLTGIFSMSQFFSSASYTVIVLLLFGIASLTTVTGAMAGQALSAAYCIIFFTFGWKCMPHRESKRVLETGQSILTAGFKQNFNTAVSIHQHYRKGLKWYLLALIFAESSSAAITSVSVIYLTDSVGLDTAQIGLFFLIALVAAIPGARMGSSISHYLQNPNTSWKFCQFFLIVTMVIGAFTLDGIAIKELSYLWGGVVGLFLGWFYQTENL
jgi:MFS-type transporter involved in bile tolerance (Atg22 family)